MAQEKNNKPIYKKWWFWLIVVIIVAGIGTAVGSQGNKNVESTSSATEKNTESSASSSVEPTPAPEFTEVNAADILSAYDENGVSADNEYKNKLLKITGTVKSVGVDAAEKPYVLLADERNEYAILGIQCYFSDKNKDSLTSLKEGDAVTVTGTCEGKVINISVKDCELN